MRLSAKDRKALSSLKSHTRRVLSRPGIANAGRHVALLIIDASGLDSHQTVVADLTLACHFGQPSELASLEAAVAAGSCDRRTAQCNAESAAAAPLSHRQKQAWCAKVAANARRAKAIKHFNDADGCWPAQWHVPNEICFDNPISIRAGHMCKVAGVDVKQIDALVEALAMYAAEYAPSEMDVAACPECVTVPLLSYELMLNAGLLLSAGLLHLDVERMDKAKVSLLSVVPRYRGGPAVQVVVSLAARLSREAQPRPARTCLSARLERLRRLPNTVLRRHDANIAMQERLRRWCNSVGREFPRNVIGGVTVNFGLLFNLLEEYGGPEHVEVSVSVWPYCSLPPSVFQKPHH